MYCNRPSQEQLEAQPRRSRRADSAATAPESAAALDSLTPSLEASLAEAIRTLGTTSDSAYVLEDGKFAVKLGGAGDPPVL